MGRSPTVCPGEGVVAFQRWEEWCADTWWRDSYGERTKPETVGAPWVQSRTVPGERTLAPGKRPI